jgi:MoxR-like ATPase
MARTSTVDIAAVNADLRTRYGATVTRVQLFAYRDETGIYPVWIRRDESLRVGRGIYRIPTDSDPAPTRRVSKSDPKPSPRGRASQPDVSDDSNVVVATVAPTSDPAMTLTAASLASMDILARMEAIKRQASLLSNIPDRAPEFVPFGDYDMIRQVVASRKFFPVFIVGLSGNGKTFQIEQACAAERREYVRVNITEETDEDDLIGGFRLVDGNTVFELGPVLVAMIRGAVLLVDEIDYASPKIACIQSVLEGRSITVKKLGIVITPTPGFTVFATANTKGRGSDDGKFVGANLLNEAFLDRFPVTVEQDYPSIAVEKKILAKTFQAEGFTMTPHAATFFDTLARWADGIRSTYAAGGIEDLIATRRLVHIVRAYGLFNGDDQKALMYCVNRFEAKVKDAFIDLYNKLAPDPDAASNVGDLD